MSPSHVGSTPSANVTDDGKSTNEQSKPLKLYLTAEPTVTESIANGLNGGDRLEKAAKELQDWQDWWNKASGK